MRILLLFGSALALLVGASFAAKAAEPAISAPIIGATGAAIGNALLRPGPGGVLIEMEIQAGALTPGWHGLHFHQSGTCADAGFKASGAHVGHVEGAQHGLLNPMGPEAGDLPNLFVPEAGPARAQVFTALMRLDPGPHAFPVVRDADGSALVIHAGPDDQSSQPIGGAGARLACAAFLASPAR
jgi:superoxide dismutase, Cu-Zn family